MVYLDSLICSCDESNEQWQHHVDEKGDKGVQVHLTKEPHQRAALLQLRKSHKHVVSVNQGEKALWHHWQRTELEMERVCQLLWMEAIKSNNIYLPSRGMVQALSNHRSNNQGKLQPHSNKTVWH